MGKRSVWMFTVGVGGGASDGGLSDSSPLSTLASESHDRRQNPNVMLRKVFFVPCFVL